MIRKALPLLAFLSLIYTAGSASAQVDTPPTAFEKQLHKIDLSISGVGIFNRSVSGTVIPTSASNAGKDITEYGSNTAGALVTLHYVAKPFFGVEANYGYARFDQNYGGNAFVDFPSPVFQVQSKVNEYTFGYFATPQHPILGFQPFFSLGGGILNFTPTPGGGQEEPERARGMVYYSVGLQQDYGQHLGLRAGFREQFYKAPDFNQPYLMINKRTTTYEPMIGFYLRY